MVTRWREPSKKLANRPGVGGAGEVEVGHSRSVAWLRTLPVP